MILVAIGSNLYSKDYGSPYNNCKKAIEFLKRIFNVVKISNFYKSEPIPKSDQPWYVNAVIQIKCKMKPEEILKELLKIEKELKRSRVIKNEARIIDLDLLSYDDLVIKSSELILPHPRMHLRKFVMKPICDLSLKWEHPILGKKAEDILKTLANQQIFNINT